MKEKIGVFFCSASNTIDPRYNQAAREIVRAACLRGYTISSGGTIKGTMKVVVDEAKACGAATLGVIPKFMAPMVHPDLDRVVWTGTMSERKEQLRAGASFVVALPGGIGTLDEVVETLTLAKLSKFAGKVICYNFKGFYDRFIDLLDFYVETGMLDASARAMALFPSTPEEFEKLI